MTPTINTPGYYKISSDLTTLHIHNSDDETTVVVGSFFKNDTIPVYQVLPVNARGIEWGLVVPQNAPVKKYAALSVNGKPKMVRFSDFDTSPKNIDQAIDEVLKIVKEIRDILKK